MKDKKSNLGPILGCIGTAITAGGFIATALINKKSRKKAIETQSEKDAEKHTAMNSSDINKEEAISRIRVSEKRQMLELELEYKQKLQGIKSVQSESPSESEEGAPARVSQALSIDDIKKTEVAPRFNMVGEILSSRDLCTIVADPGVGKTTLSYQIAYHACKGTQPEFVPGAYPAYPAHEVHYYDGENSTPDLKVIFGDSDLSGCDKLHIIPQPRFNSVDEFITDIRSRIDNDLEDHLIIVDNVFKFFNASQPVHVANFFSEIERLQEEMSRWGKNVTVIILDHTIDNADPFKPITMKKMGGSSHIARFSKTITTLFPIRNCENKIGLKVLKSRFMPKPGVVDVLERISGKTPGYQYLASVEEADLSDGYVDSNTGGGPTESQKQLILQLCNSNPKPSDKDIAARLGVCLRTFATWKKALGLTGNQNP